MWREAHWAHVPQWFVVSVPMVVKALDRVGRASFCKEQGLVIIHFCQLLSSSWVMQRTDLLNVGREGLLNSGVVTEVEGLDFTPITALVHYSCLTSKTLIAIATHRHQNDLVQSGPCILEQFEHGFLAQRNFSAVDERIEHSMDALTHISQFLT